MWKNIQAQQMTQTETGAVRLQFVCFDEWNWGYPESRV